MVAERARDATSGETRGKEKRGERRGEERTVSGAHAARGRADREKKLSAGICIEYSLTFLARLPSAADRQATLRYAGPACRAASLYHCAYLCTLIISNMGTRSRSLENGLLVDSRSLGSACVTRSRPRTHVLYSGAWDGMRVPTPRRRCWWVPIHAEEAAFRFFLSCRCIV